MLACRVCVFFPWWLAVWSHTSIHHFEILERVNDNAYKVNLPGDYGVSATFNVADLQPEDDHLSNLRANSFQQGEDDGEPSMELSQGLLDGPRRPHLAARIKEEVQMTKPGPGLTRLFVHATAQFCLLYCQRSRMSCCLYGAHFSSLGFKLSNKTDCSPFGARLLGQMVP